MTLTSTLMEVSEGARGTAQTLAIMSGLVKRYKKNLQIRGLALSLVQGIQEKDWFSELAAIHEFVRDQIRYVRDIRGVETIHDPVTLLKFGQGDCDDKSVLAAALLESIGFETRFVAVGFEPDQYSHVYLEARVPGGWVALETTEPWELGQYVTGIITKMVYDNA